MPLNENQKQVRLGPSFLMVTDDQKIARWLGEKARHGWHLNSMRFPGIYTFIKGAPGNFVYQFDFRDRTKLELREYIALCRDMGWEYVGEFERWHCFRIDADMHPVQDLFTDYTALAEKYRRSLSFQAAAFVPLILIFATNLSVDVYECAVENEDISPSSVLTWLIIFMFVVFIGKGLVRSFHRYRQAKSQALQQEA